ncbi:glutathione hydrolase 1 proenzyme isoform X2 [Plutella xylostella]|uniref:glutathione hydrolase 1 proenzyme isoform X2 n=1 Tax=Plutella xylostella TaxID=51655 RepID=UPI0005D0694B|nr:glutathione hydrolase 1 proenzyme isoform X2 [Plutella xylostella]
MCDEDLVKCTVNGADRTKNRHVLLTVPKNRRNRPKTRLKVIITLLGIMVVIAALAGYFIGKAESKNRLRIEPPDPAVAPPASWSKLRVFQKGAVCTDSPQCSEIGRSILSKNGSAVDAAIGALFCNGLLNQQSMGIGGGHFMMVYIKDEGRAYSVVAREKAPAAATQDMFNGDYNKGSKGPLAVAVPGEVAGMWLAHQRWGVLPWAELLAPTLDICEKGFVMSKVTYDGLQDASYIINDVNMRKQYYDEYNKKFHPPGSTIYPAKTLCTTLQRIADKGGNEFYNGSLAKDIADDLKSAGSIITLDDLRNYQAKISEPITIQLSEGDTLYSPPPPSSGVLLGYIMNILSGYNFTSESVTTTDRMIQTYYRILEAFKYAFATRTRLGDVDFLDLQELIQNVSSVEFASSIRMKINETMTSNDTDTYGADKYMKGDSGTAHISIMAPNGDAVSVTSSINYYYGAGFTTKNTGINLNNVMDDFSSPGITNYFGIEPSEANFIRPGKRPLSSMAPAIIVDRDGNAKLVIGASGGTKIITAVALVTIRKLWFDQTVKEAVDAPRFHHQITPMDAEYEYGIIEDVVSGLRAKGHGMVRYSGRGSIVCALFRNKTAIYANADFRKGGDVSGLD